MLNQQPTLDIIRSNWYQVQAQVHKIKSQFIQSARDNIAEVYDLHRFESAAEHLEFIDFHLADNRNRFLLQSVWKVVYVVQIECRESRKLLTNG